GNKLLGDTFGFNLRKGQFIVTGNDGVTGWEFINIEDGVEVILNSNKDDTYNKLPTPSSFYRGKQIVIKGDASYNDRIYICVKIANTNRYEWKEVVYKET